MENNWLAVLLERNSADPLARLKLGATIQEELDLRGIPLHNKLINDFCDVIYQWLSASNFKVSFLALEILQTGLDVSGDVLAAYYFDRISPLIERMGDSKQQVRDAAVNLLLSLAYLENSSPTILLDRLMHGTAGFSHKQWLVKCGCLFILRDFLNTSYPAVQAQANALVPRICQMMNDPNSEVRDAATTTLVDVMVAGGPTSIDHIRSSRLVPDQKMSVLLQRYDAAPKDAFQRHTETSSSQSVRRSLRAPMKVLFPSRLSTPPTAPPRNGNQSLSPSSPLQTHADPFGAAPNSAASSSSSTSSRSRSFGLSPDEAPSSIRRSMSSVRRPLPATAARPTGSAGALSEEDFRKTFTQVPKCQVFTPQDVAKHLESAKATLEKPDEDWSKRVNALKLIRAVVANGGKEFDKQLNASLLSLCDALETSVKDLRSQVVREACITCSYLIDEFGASLQRVAEAVLPHALLLVPNSVKVMSTSGATLATFIVKNVPCKQIQTIVSNQSSSKAKELRRHSAALVLQMLANWDQSLLQKQIPSLTVLVKAAICDADNETRQFGRQAYHRMEEIFPDHAKNLFASLDPSRQKQVSGGASAASSSQSLNSERGAALGMTSRLGTLSGRNTAFFAQRSSSAIDPKSVRMTATPLRGTLGMSRGRPGAAFDRSPNGTQFARPAFSTSRAPSTPMGIRQPPAAQSTSFQVHPGRRSSATSSQPGSRNGSPPRERHESHLNNGFRPNVVRSTHAGAEHRVGGGFSSSPAKPLDTREMLRALSELNQNSRMPTEMNDEDDFLLPTRSPNPNNERMEAARLDMALRACSSSSANEKKEGVRALATIAPDPNLPSSDVKRIGEALCRLLAEGFPQTVVLALEVVPAFVRTHHTQLHAWLPLFLGRLISKASVELLPAIKTNCEHAKNAILTSFDPQLQLTSICKYMTDTTVSVNPKGRLAILKYMSELIKSHMERGATYNTKEVQQGVRRIFKWLDDPRNAIAHPQCEEVLCDLFALNAADFSMMCNSFEGLIRDCAYRILQQHGHNEQAASPANGDSDCVRANISSTSAQINDFVSQRLGSVLSSTPRAANGVATSSLGSFNHTPPGPQPSTMTRENDDSDILTVLNSSGENWVFESTIHLAHDTHAQSKYIQERIDVLSNSNDEDESKKALLGLHNMMCEGSFTAWDAFFQKLLLCIFDVLGRCELGVRKAALRVLIKMCHAQAARLFDSTEMTICKVLDAAVNVSEGTFMIVAEDCLKTLATHLPLAKVVSCAYAMLNKTNVEDTRMTLTLKMLTRLFESTDADELAPIIDEIAPAVVACYDAPTSVVRKCSVFCLVAMVNKLGNGPMQPYLKQLSANKVQIIQLYVARTKSSSSSNV